MALASVSDRYSDDSVADFYEHGLRTATGKIQKHVLRAEIAARPERVSG